MDASAQEGADGQHRGRGVEALTGGRDHAAYAVAVDEQVGALALEQLQIGFGIDGAADRGAVQRPVALGARGAYGRALAGVQRAELDAGGVGRARHGPAQGIDLARQMALADAADGRIARHLADSLDVLRQQQRATAHARGGECGLGAGVAAANDDDVECVIVSRFPFPVSGRHGSAPAATRAAQWATLNGQRTRHQNAILPVSICHHIFRSPL